MPFPTPPLTSREVALLVCTLAFPVAALAGLGFAVWQALR